jgi:hypothetical protein
VIDRCVTQYAVGCPVVAEREQCDGRDFGGVGQESCVAQGYGSGTLTCASDCTVDPITTCSPCLPQGSLVAGCGPLPLDSQYFSLPSLAATETEVGVALIAYGQYPNQWLLFERVAPDLSVLGTSSFPTPDGTQFGTALAPLPKGGWTIAVCADHEVYLQTLTAAGEDAGRVSVARDIYTYSICTSSTPVLAARPGGGPLLLWQSEAGTYMSLVADDGLSVSPPQLVVGDKAQHWDSPAAAWVGDEFAVAAPLDLDGFGLVRALRLLRIGPDGSVGVVSDHLMGEFDANIRMANGPDARDVRIVYSGVTPGGDTSVISETVWWRPDPSGPGQFALVAMAPDFYGPAPAVALGDDTVVLASRVYGDGIGVTRLTSDGRVVWPYREVARSSPGYTSGFDMVRRGPEIVVAFSGPGQIYLERLKP